VDSGQWAVGSSGGEGDVGEKAAGSGEWSVVSGQWPVKK
jgi:hypothetical protein